MDVTLTGSATTALFSESQSRFVVTVKEENAAAFVEIMKDAQRIGVVTNDALVKINGDKGVLVEGTVEEFRSNWKGAIPCLLNSEA